MGKVVYYNYQEALGRVEAFMKATGIRTYCETICKGYCCRDCYGKSTACHVNEGRRLACSYFICLPLMYIVFTNSTDRGKYESVGHAIHCSLTKAAENHQYENHYFVPYTKKQMKAFRIRKSVFDKNMPTADQITSIANTMRHISSLANRMVIGHGKSRIAKKNEGKKK